MRLFAAWRRSSRLALVSVVSLSAAVMHAPPAHADVRPLLAKYNGEWKAYATYDDAANQLCVRVYNSTAGANAVFTLDSPAVEGVVGDHGGDNNKTCKVIQGVIENQQAGFNLNWYGSAGAHSSDFAVGTT